MDLAGLFNLGLAFTTYKTNMMQLKNEQYYQQNKLAVYKYQREVNDKVVAFNFNQRMRLAERQASSVRSAFAAAGLTGGTIEDDINRYKRDLIVAAYNDVTNYQ